jgi:hypothetical protein
VVYPGSYSSNQGYQIATRFTNNGSIPVPFVKDTQVSFVTPFCPSIYGSYQYGMKDCGNPGAAVTRNGVQALQSVVSIGNNNYYASLDSDASQTSTYFVDSTGKIPAPDSRTCPNDHQFCRTTLSYLVPQGLPGNVIPVGATWNVPIGVQTAFPDDNYASNESDTIVDMNSSNSPMLPLQPYGSDKTGCEFDFHIPFSTAAFTSINPKGTEYTAALTVNLIKPKQTDVWKLITPINPKSGPTIGCLMTNLADEVTPDDPSFPPKWTPPSPYGSGVATVSASITGKVYYANVNLCASSSAMSNYLIGTAKTSFVNTAYLSNNGGPPIKCTVRVKTLG